MTGHAGASTLRLRVGHEVVDSGSAQGVAEAVAVSNRAHRIDGLPDALNPGIIDPAKAEALRVALPRLPEESLKPIAGRALYLNSPGLLIGTAAPTTPASFEQPFWLDIVDAQGETVLARATVSIDCDLARAHASAARARFGAAEQDVKTTEAQKAAAAGRSNEAAALRALSGAQARRFAIAQVWRTNASAVTGCDPRDQAAKADLAAAEQAVRATVVAPRTGMP